jgi:hypothetical protein
MTARNHLDNALASLDLARQSALDLLAVKLHLAAAAEHCRLAGFPFSGRTSFRKRDQVWTIRGSMLRHVEESIALLG